MMTKNKEWLLQKIHDERVQLAQSFTEGKETDDESAFNDGRDRALSSVLRLIEQLDEPEQTDINVGLLKPTVPRFVADWIDKYQKYEDIYTALSDGFDGFESGEVYSWLHGYEGVGNQELFARAWLDGFTVEEEQKYRVSSKMADTGGFWFLSKNNDGI